MLSPQELRLFRKFKHRKFRQESNWFVAEGKKLCLDIWKYRPDWIEKIYLHEESEKELKKEFPPAKVCIVQSKELKEITQTMHSQGILALCRKQMKPIPESMRTLSFYLCGIQDPGNVGTIIRTCAWFGITDIFCSSDTADFYHPKVIQASMGAFMYCHLHTINLQDLLNKKIFNTCVRADMQGEVLASVQGKNVLILLGNEGKGFSEEIRKKVPHAVSIPAFAEEGPESLNVAVTCGIFAYVFSNKKGHPADALYSDEQPAPD